MFGNKKDEGPVGRPISTGTDVNILSAGTEFEGKVKTEGDIRIDGKFIGDLTCKAKVIIGPSGSFNGTIQCENAVIEGSFSGKLNVKSMLEVKENGKLNGEILTNKLIVQAGAIFDVSCSMGDKKTTPIPSSSQEKRTVSVDEKTN
jgi:cytoskeletal protein CcmA (bactofilin family)